MSTSKNTRPARSRRRQANVHGAVPAETPAASASPRQGRPASSWKAYLRGAAMVHAVLVLVAVACAMAILLLAAESLGDVASVAAQLWLLMNAAPIVIAEIPLGFVPLLPAVGVVALVQSRVHVAVKDRISLAGLGSLAAFMLALPLILTGVALAVAQPPAPVVPALVNTLLVHGGAFIIGMRGKLWRALARHANLPVAAVNAVRSGAAAVGGLAIAGCVLWLVCALVAWPRQQEIFAEFSGPAAVIGILVVTIAYLPNVAVGGAALLAGGDVMIGNAHVSLFSAALVPLPPLPIFAAIPGSVAQWAVVLLIIPAAIAGYAAYKAAPTWWEALIAGAGAAVTAAWALHLAGGTMGAYGYTGPDVWLSAGVIGVWVAGMGLGLSLVITLQQRRGVEPESAMDTEEAEVEVSEDVDKHDEEPADTPDEGGEDQQQG
ncbi:cell division protein PerM [Corynebacterium renale]|uniref:Uncharacterized protein n=1 Tax=Corynebacterium renale TaxID=1724 RepID=A0A2A9DJY0_9CORY|nr:DUF6350 family protein [Corynebacterium renale]PFG26998.1 hypothetical protein ATK06_0039 [Corynebacterium renale]SQI24470.1 hypothetical membrane protein [Corynebacterium renale]